MLEIIDKVKKLKARDQMIIAESILNSFNVSEENEISQEEILEIKKMEKDYKKNRLFFTKEEALAYV